MRGLCSQSALQRSVELHPPRGRGRSIDRSWSGRKRRSSCERASERGRKRRGDDGSERSSRQKNIDRIWPPRQKEEEKKKKRSGFPVFTRKRDGRSQSRSQSLCSPKSQSEFRMTALQTISSCWRKSFIVRSSIRPRPSSPPPLHRPFVFPHCEGVFRPVGQMRYFHVVLLFPLRNFNKLSSHLLTTGQTRQF